MVTVTLHDADAAEVLKLIHRGRFEVPQPKAVMLDRAEESFKCALALCDCGQTPPTVGRADMGAGTYPPQGEAGQ